MNFYWEAGARVTICYNAHPPGQPQRPCCSTR
jgi:hypothetical protein